MKYFVFWGDYAYDLEYKEFDTEEEALNHVIHLKMDTVYEIIRVIKGDELRIEASYKFSSKE